MKQQEFLSLACKKIAANEIRSGAARRLIVEIAANGYCRPCWEISRAYSDHTGEILHILTEKFKIQQQGTCTNGLNVRRGWIVKNDAPRGGKCGNIIVVNFDDVERWDVPGNVLQGYKF